MYSKVVLNMFIRTNGKPVLLFFKPQALVHLLKGENTVSESPPDGDHEILKACNPQANPRKPLLGKKKPSSFYKFP